MKVRASRAHGDHPNTLLSLQTQSLPPLLHQKTMKSENVSDSAKVSYGTMIQTQSSVLIPNFNISEPQSQACQVQENHFTYASLLHLHI